VIQQQSHVGLVAWSFALRPEEPSRCNRCLAGEVWRIVREEEKNGRRVLIIAQGEIAEALKKLHMPLAYIVERHHITGEYLDSQEVMAQAAEILMSYGVTEVIPVANPFLHLRRCRMLVREFGFMLIERRIRRIGFDKDSLQSWTRGPVRWVLHEPCVWMYVCLFANKEER